MKTQCLQFCIFNIFTIYTFTCIHTYSFALLNKSLRQTLYWLVISSIFDDPFFDESMISCLSRFDETEQRVFMRCFYHSFGTPFIIPSQHLISSVASPPHREGYKWNITKLSIRKTYVKVGIEYILLFLYICILNCA